MKVLDTDFLIAILRGNPEVETKLSELEALNGEIATTVFNAEEILYGALISNDPVRQKKIVDRLLNSLTILTYDAPTMEEVVKIQVSLAKKGYRIGILDERISGIVLKNNSTIITRNIKHFSKIRGIKIEEW